MQSIKIIVVLNVQRVFHVVVDFSALLLNSIMSAFKPEYIASRAIEFTEMIKQCEETGFPKVNIASNNKWGTNFNNIALNSVRKLFSQK